MPTSLRRCHAPALLLALLPLLAMPAGAGQADPWLQQRWGDGRRLEPLPLLQSSGDPESRNQIELLIRPEDVPRPYRELRLIPAPSLDGRSLARHLRLCRMVRPAPGRRAPCLAVLPLRLTDEAGTLRLQLRDPLVPGGSYGLSVVLRNPTVEGLHPVRLFGLSSDRSGPEYIGTWLIEVLSQAE